MATALLDAVKRSKQAPPDTTTKEDDDEVSRNRVSKDRNSALECSSKVADAIIEENMY